MQSAFSDGLGEGSNAVGAWEAGREILTERFPQKSFCSASTAGCGSRFNPIC